MLWHFFTSWKTILNFIKKNRINVFNVDHFAVIISSHTGEYATHMQKCPLWMCIDLSYDR